MNGEPGAPRLYGQLAAWWPLLSAPEDYAEEAAFFRRTIEGHAEIPVREVLELGSGGGNNASHLKRNFDLTLVDRSPGMLAVSRRLNPECRHVEGDMRTCRLQRTFDAVFVHDAVSYLTTEPDLASAMETAFLHCAPGGVALFCPDVVRERFRSCADHGGHDDPAGSGAGLRYLEWSWDPDPADTRYVTDFVYLLRHPGGRMETVYDRHELGLFSRDTWLDLLCRVGFVAHAIPFEHSELEPGSCEFFLAKRRPGRT